ncbi:hypothetical protein ACVRXI_04465 [Streptococcus ovis]
MSDNLDIQVIGYPGQNISKRGDMYYKWGTIRSIQPTTFDYAIYGEKGQSGGPVLNAENKVVGVHVAGRPNSFDGQGDTVNVARRINEDTLKMIALAKENQEPSDGIVSNTVPSSKKVQHPITVKVRHVVVDKNDSRKIIKELSQTDYKLEAGWSVKPKLTEESGYRFVGGNNRIWYDDIKEKPNHEVILKYHSTEHAQTPPAVTSTSPTTTTKEEAKTTTTTTTTTTQVKVTTTAKVVTTPSTKVTTKSTTKLTIKPTTKSTTKVITKPNTKVVIKTSKQTTNPTTTKLVTRTTSKPTTKLTTKSATKSTTKLTTKASPLPRVQLKEVYRLYHAGLKVHLYTTD